jgi:hypothetical protein
MLSIKFLMEQKRTIEQSRREQKKQIEQAAEDKMYRTK